MTELERIRILRKGLKKVTILLALVLLYYISVVQEHADMLCNDDKYDVASVFSFSSTVVAPYVLMPEYVECVSQEEYERMYYYNERWWLFS